MKACDLEIGQEYEITAQKNISGGWSRTFNQGRVKLISKTGSRYLCSYLENPYEQWRYAAGKGNVVVSGRSLLRPWAEVAFEQEEKQAWDEMWEEAQKDREQEVADLDLSWTGAAVQSVNLSAELTTEEATVEIEIPLDMLRALSAHFKDHERPKPQKAVCAESSELAELLS